MALHNRLKEHRARLSINQSELGRMAGVSRQTISLIERGDYSPSVTLALKLAAIATHVADLRTCVLHPASTTHRQMNDQQLAEAGVTPDLIRFSVGIEHPEDILFDIRQALDLV